MRKLKFGGVTPSDLTAPVARLALVIEWLDGNVLERRRIVLGWHKGAPLALLGQAIYGPPWPRDLFEPVPDKWLPFEDDHFVATALAWPGPYKPANDAVLAGGFGTTAMVYMAQKGTKLTLMFQQDQPSQDFLTMIQGMQVKQVIRGIQ